MATKLYEYKKEFTAITIDSRKAVCLSKQVAHQRIAI
jgi:hypothetical protein